MFLKDFGMNFLSYRPLSNCSCGAIHQLAEFHEIDRVMDFLQGLNDSYSNVHSDILLIDPLPPVARVYYLLLQEELHRSLELDLVGMLSQHSANINDDSLVT
ncbi:hypothetical protein ACH5RR_021700 [Cinchona calisaya]|uniref:GPN-loop GTPase 2 n=1 Tax=Cinchona calisaya TaxID=153742 RepID=A0ABD2ZI12_9GENT